MKSSKKRKKAYKPKGFQTKLTAIDKALFSKVLEKYKEASAIYEFEMTLHLESVIEKMEAYLKAHNLQEMPKHGLLEIYDETDAAIAIVMAEVDYLNWEVAVDTSLYNFETGDVTNVPFYVELPDLNYTELMEGSKASVKRNSGFKTRWKGLQKEVAEDLCETLPIGYTIVRTMYSVKFQAKFKNKALFDEFKMLRNLRDEGLLLPFVELAEESLLEPMTEEEILGRLNAMNINQDLLNKVA